MCLLYQINNTKNHFTLLRVLAAIAVVYSHSFPLFGVKMEPLYAITGYDNLGNIALRVFFVVSGFFITKSWFDRSDVMKFLWNRFLRVYPAAIVCTFITIVVLAVGCNTLPFYSFLVSKLTLRYAFYNSVLFLSLATGLPGVFENNPFRDVVNGSLWTISVEIKLYLVILGLGIFKLLKHRAFILLTTVALAITMLCQSEYQVLNKAWFALYFLAGSVYYLYRQYIYLHWGLALSAVFLLLAYTQTPLYPLVTLMTLPYLIFYLAYLPLPKILAKPFELKQDLSYGIYLYAWPIQQYLMASHLEIIRTPQMLFLLTLAIVFPIAYLSWHFIEKPSLSFKTLDIGKNMRNAVSSVYYRILGSIYPQHLKRV